MMPTTGKVNVTPLEDKTTEEEPVVYANKLVRKTSTELNVESPINLLL
jgi:pre-mRNA-processing factor 40